MTGGGHRKLGNACVRGAAEESVAPREQPVSQRAQRLRAMAERRQGPESLSVQAADPLLRRLDSNDCRMGRLGMLAIGMGWFAQRCRISDHIQQVVLNLECETDLSRKTVQRLVQARVERGRAGRGQ